MTHPDQHDSQQDTAPASEQEREYDKSGFYPEEGKAFRIWALLGWLMAVVVMLALASAVLNYLLLD